MTNSINPGKYNQYLNLKNVAARVNEIFGELSDKSPESIKIANIEKQFEYHKNSALFDHTLCQATEEEVLHWKKLCRIADKEICMFLDTVPELYFILTEDKMNIGMCACNYGLNQTIKRFLDHKTAPFLQDKSGYNILMHLAMNNNKEMLKYGLKYTTLLRQQTKDLGYNVGMIAAAHGMIDIAKECNKDVEAKRQYTPDGKNIQFFIDRHVAEVNFEPTF